MAIGVSVFRRRHRGKLAKRYTIQVRMPDGTTKQRAGYTDRGATQQLAAQWVRALERKEVGLHDPFGTARTSPISKHLDAFIVAMENGTLSRRRRGQVSAEWVRRTRKRLETMLRELGATRIEHLQLNEAEVWLHAKVDTGWSARTRDHHAALLRQFGEWLVDDNRAADNAFSRLRPIADASTVTFRRQALTLEQLGKLVEAAEVRGVQEYAKVNPSASPENIAGLRMLGRVRSVLYLVAAYSGLRRGEVTRLIWADLQAGEQPAISVRPEIAKNRRAVRIELPVWLGGVLEELRVDTARANGRPPAQGDVMLPLSYRHLTERLKLDAVFAGIGSLGERSRVYSADGLVIDFHALRYTCAELVSQSRMGLKQIEQHMRHSSAKLTMEVYLSARRDLMRGDVEKLLPPPAVVAPANTPVEPFPAASVIDRPCPGGEESRRDAK